MNRFLTVFFLIWMGFRGGSRGRVQGVGTPPPPPPRDGLRFSNTTGILPKKKTMWLIGVKVEQETSAPPAKKNPGSAPGVTVIQDFYSILPNFHIVLCIPLISWFLLLDHNKNNSKLVQ